MKATKFKEVDLVEKIKPNEDGTHDVEMLRFDQEKGEKDLAIIGGWVEGERDYYNRKGEVYTSAPTIAEVVMWLYEKHNIWIWVEQEDTTNQFQWFCRYENKGSCKDYDDKFYKTPTEVYLSAIEYTLNNLI